jgi:hypothetical protein
MSYRYRNKGGNKGKNKSTPKSERKMHIAAKENIEIEATIAKANVSNRLKTLIVFDTNSLRSTDSGEVVYSSFSFGKAYDVINGFIVENKLQDDVFVAVSALVVDEIKIQMERSYKADCQRLGDTKRRMNGLPHVAAELIGIPDNDFNCSDYVENKAKEYLKNNQHVKLLNFSNDQSEQILKSLISRAHKTRPPFFKTSKNSDAGFKDSVIWETLLNYNEIEKYNKIILVTKDEGFKGCETEFASKWNKHFKIIAAPEAVNTELGIDYNNYIKETTIHDYAQTDYFRDYLFDGIKVKNEIVIDDVNYKIQNFEIADICKEVERIPPTDDELDECIVISSSIKIFFMDKGKKKEQVVIAKTTLADEETKDIIETTFEPELI